MNFYSDPNARIKFCIMVPMNLLVNGETTSLANVATVSDLIAALEIEDNVAVEINREIVSRSAFDQHRLADGDQVEIVTAIGGG